MYLREDYFFYLGKIRTVNIVGCPRNYRQKMTKIYTKVPPTLVFLVGATLSGSHLFAVWVCLFPFICCLKICCKNDSWRLLWWWCGGDWWWTDGRPYLNFMWWTLLLFTNLIEGGFEIFWDFDIFWNFVKLCETFFESFIEISRQFWKLEISVL